MMKLGARFYTRPQHGKGEVVVLSGGREWWEIYFVLMFFY